jgi:hypothetical protein
LAGSPNGGDQEEVNEKDDEPGHYTHKNRSAFDYFATFFLVGPISRSVV